MPGLRFPNRDGKGAASLPLVSPHYESSKHWKMRWTRPSHSYITLTVLSRTNCLILVFS